jgi:translocation and assembly module TamB
MTRPVRIIRNIFIAGLAMILVLGVGAILLVQTAWFRNYIKEKIVTSIADSTGGRVEAGSFQFDWTHLRAVLTNSVLHGNEPPGVAPLLRVARIQVDLRLFTIHGFWNIAALDIDQPQANVIVYPDGSTNLPAPRQKSTSSPLEDVVDLAIGHFEINNGLVTVAAQKHELNVRGNNLRALLSYNTLSQKYSGQISLQPLYVVSGRNTPVDFTVSLPVTLARDKIEVHGARIASPLSTLALDASLDHLQNPRVSARLNGHIALADLKRAANLPLNSNAPNLPSSIDLDANATTTGSSIQVANLRLTLGQSSIEASGPLDRGLDFKSRLSLDELARLANTSTHLAGVVGLDGIAKLDAQNNFNLNDLHIAALGAEFSGDISVQGFARYQLRGNLRHLDIQNAIRAAGEAPLPYDGVVSGALDADGNFDAPFLRQLTAHVQLSIAPGPRGVPVSGHLNAAYTGLHDNLTIRNSLLTLPHSSLTIDGSPGKQLNVALTTTNLDDLLSSVAPSSRPQVALNGGQASFTGTVSGPLASPRIAGHFTASQLSFADRQFDSLFADASLSKSGAVVQGGGISRGAMQAGFSGSLGLRDWKTFPTAPVSVNAAIQNGDLADLLALAGQPSAGYSGQLAANVTINGTFGNPGGSGTLTITAGAVDGQPFDRAQAQINLTDQLITVPSASIQAGAARVNFTAEFQHPRDSFTTGQLRAKVQSTQVDLAQLTALQKQRPHTSGIVQLTASLAGNLSDAKSSPFQLTSVDGNASVHGLQSEGQNYGDLTATAKTSGQSVSYNLTSNFAGSNISVTGDTQLLSDYPTTARATLANLSIERVLAIAHRTDIPMRGMLSGTADFNGTAANPQGSADFNLSKASLYDDAVDRLHARFSYLPRSIDLAQLEIVSGPSRIDLSAHYDHPAGDIESGNLQFYIDPSSINLARVKTVTDRSPGLAGTVQIDARGAAQIRPSEPRIMVSELNANIKAAGLATNGGSLGDLTLTANTASGRVNLALDSNLAGASLEGRGAIQLASGYPTTAQLTFKNVTWTRLAPLLGSSSVAPQGFEAAADGEASVNGQLTDAQQLRGSFQLTRLQLSSNSSLLRKAGSVLLQNQGPISAALDHGVIRIQSAHLTGPQTDLEASGALPLSGQPLDLALKGNLDLAILEKLDQSITSSGSIVLGATVHGTLTQPVLGGQLELRNSSLAYAGLPTGIWKANGVVLLNGDSAVIRNLAAEVGGGRLTLAGSASLNGSLRFGLQAHATRVRLMVQPGLSVIVSANINAAGTTANSSISGAVTLDQVIYASRTDLGSILSLAAPPVQASTPAPLLDNMRLDLRVRSSSALAVQSSVAQNLQMDADLRIRGTAAQPGILGRINITEGKLLFFGSTYTVNTGSISFFNPIRVEPILDLSLEAQAQGVDVDLKVTGPIDNMKLSYTSNPPLQFQEIVSLLAAGTTPTSDPTLLANQPSIGSQSFQQMGESAIVGAALADPVSSQLQRVFGVTQVKISPTFAGGSDLPVAQFSLTQQISNNLTFTYVTGLNTANAETVQALWTFTPIWSAQALLDYNGILSVTLIYKRQFR